MLKPYQVRVEATYFSILHVLEILKNEGQNIRQLNLAADSCSASKEFRKKPFHLDFRTTTDSVMIDFNPNCALENFNVKSRG